MLRNVNKLQTLTNDQYFDLAIPERSRTRVRPALKGSTSESLSQLALIGPTYLIH
ncbi:hypothetical protein LC605_11485 [Nostoc sp. CHAB 5836]|nr:hypothetical protein [Nostoc sp. CHAB 5836]